MIRACKLLMIALMVGAMPVLNGCTKPPSTAQFKTAFAKGTAAFDAGDFEAARRHWQPLAKHYDLAAMRNLGHLYRKGLGVKRDAKKAHDYYHAAAKRGFAPAQYNLARMYFAGNGIPRNADKAMNWLKRAAALNYKPAQDYLHLITQKVELFEN